MSELAAPGRSNAKLDGLLGSIPRPNSNQMPEIYVVVRIEEPGCIEGVVPRRQGLPCSENVRVFIIEESNRRVRK